MLGVLYSALNTYTHERGIFMSYKTFCNKTKELVKKSGILSPVRFFIHDDGRYFAKCDGVTIIGNSICESCWASWGYGQHMARFNFAALGI